MIKVNSKIGASLALGVMMMTLAGCASDGPEEDFLSPAPTVEQSAPADEPEDSTEEPADPTTEQPAEAGDQANALAAYVELEQSAIPAALEASAEVYSDIAINAIEPATVEYVYTYKNPVDVEVAQAAFDEAVPTIQEACDTQLFPAMEASGVEGPYGAVYTYLNSDGSEIWSESFTSE